jgi:hypothetical protein
MTTTVLGGFTSIRPAAGFFRRTLRAVMAAQAARADRYVGSYLAYSQPEMAANAGFDVGALRAQPRVPFYI